MVLVLIRLFTMPLVYTSRCILMPLPLEQVEQGVGGGFGGASMRGLLVGGGSSDAYAAAAFLESGQLMNAVIKDLGLEKELFRKSWDSKAKKWRGKEPHPGKSRRAFDRRVDVSYDGYTGLVEVQVHWWSAERAREITAAIVETGDRMLREAAIADGKRRVEELQREMHDVTVSEIGSFLAEEITQAISSLASIRARSGYAFRVIDAPLAPDKKSWPPRLLLLILTGMATAGIEVGAVAGARARRSGRGSGSSSSA
jgi:capsule polysaccharide export protein KpsE/RkpR